MIVNNTFFTFYLIQRPKPCKLEQGDVAQEGWTPSSKHCVKGSLWWFVVHVIDVVQHLFFMFYALEFNIKT